MQHKCKHCGRTFSRRNSLRNHLKTHNTGNVIDRILEEIAEETSQQASEENVPVESENYENQELLDVADLEEEEEFVNFKEREFVNPEENKEEFVDPEELIDVEEKVEEEERLINVKKKAVAEVEVEVEEEEEEELTDVEKEEFGTDQVRFSLI